MVLVVVAVTVAQGIHTVLSGLSFTPFVENSNPL